MTHAETLARRIVDEFPELSGADRSRCLYNRDRIAELAENAIGDAVSDAAFTARREDAAEGRELGFCAGWVAAGGNPDDLIDYLAKRDQTDKAPA